MSERPEAGAAARGADAWRFAYGAIAVLAAVLLVYSMRAVLSPLLVYVLFLLILSPFTGTRTHLLAVLSATLLMLVWVLETMGGLLAPFLLALAIAYILDPAVDMLERRGLRRGLAIALLAIPVIGLLALAAVVAIPALAEQVADFLGRVPEALARIRTWLEGLRGWLGRLSIPFLPDLDALLDPDRIGEALQQRQAQIVEGGLGTLLGIGRGLGAVLGLLSYVVLTPVLIVYLLRDFDRITERVASLIPPNKKEQWLSLAREYDGLLSRFLRGQLLAAAIVGVLTWIGLWIAQFPYSGLVGAVAGVFNVVPYLGLIVSVIPVIFIALLSGNILASLLKALIVFAIVQAIDGSVTGPRIVGESVGLHPVWVILALAVGGFFFGFVGLLLAMPAAVGIKLLLREALKRYRESRVFRGTLEAGESA